MKESYYNFFIERANKVICYNSYSDSLLIIGSDAYHILLDSIYNLKKQRIDTYNILCNNGFIIDDDTNELQNLKNDYILEIDRADDMLITVYPTQDCNLKCWYCYETHIKESKMDNDVIMRIIEFVKKQINIYHPYNLSITFFGGEPLMYFDSVAYPLSLKLYGFCKANEVAFSTFFITNGSLLSLDKVKKLKQINATFQITLDGDKEKHDSVRVGKINSFPTFDKIIYGIKLITKMIDSPYKSSKYMMTIRINYDNDTLLKIDNIINALQDIPKDKVIIHLERIWQTIDNIDNSQRKLLINSYEKLVNAGFDVNIGNFRRKRVSCPAEMKHYVVINYDGRIYKCNGRTLNQKDCEGILDNNGSIVWNEHKGCRNLRSTFDNPMCSKCKLLPICIGPCSQKCIENEWKNLKKICSLRSLDVSVEDYILLRCESELKKHSYESKN
jgi:uncharacterized protein